MNIDKFNEIFSRKYGEIYIKNESDEDKTIQREIQEIEDRLNNYYKDKKIGIVSLDGSTKTVTCENLNPVKDFYHPDIHVICTSSIDDPNAFATIFEDEYYIGITKGLFIFLKDRIKDFVEDERFLNIPKIGNLNTQMVMEELYKKCRDFLVFHEFFHIQNSHCDYKKELNELEQRSSILEINIEEYMIYQTLEYDADLCAIASIVNEEIRLYHMLIEAAGIKYQVQIPKENISIFLIEAIISLYILYDLLYKGENKSTINLEMLQKRMHPTPGLRLNYIILNAFCALENNKVFNKNDIISIREETLNSLGIFIKLFNIETDPEFLKVISNEIANKHIQEVHDNWEHVRNLLSREDRVLAPYNKFDYSIYLKKE